MHHHQRFEQVTSDDFFKAKYRWDVFWRDQVPHSRHLTEFTFFLGIHKPQWGTTIRIRRSAARKIKLLNSEHCHAILMAYKARWS